jgi:putative addiction module killer protein
MKYILFETDEYDDWLADETARSKLQIEDRLEKIRSEGYFGDQKLVRDRIWELCRANGRRVYYALVPPLQVLLLLGGNKNGQTKDINKAEKIYKEWIND